MEQAYGPKLKAVGTDRGFDSLTNHIGLADEGIYNGVCPRSPRQLQKRNRSWKFKRLQRRRAQIEGRVNILKNVFLGQPLRSKGFEHRELTVTWTVLVHNLWVLARLPSGRRQRRPSAKRPSAAERISHPDDSGRAVCTPTEYFEEKSRCAHRATTAVLF